MEKISIVVPVYNAEKLIGKCIRSIQRQTNQNWNLILVDDGSTDNSGTICDSFAKDDQRIFVIHQNNKGAVEARKAGVLSEKAQSNSWITMCDADDILPADALNNLYVASMQYDADIVCGNMTKLYKGIRFPNRRVSPCFHINEPVVFGHKEFVEKLLISYFGVTNFPVNLWGKLFKSELLAKAVDNPPVVKFMGEDLSVSIRTVTSAERVVIIPDIVYCYRIGGGSSKFMPYMMDDFINLYRYKREFALKYPMPQDWQFYMDFELLNMVMTHIQQCIKLGHFDREQLIRETEKICNVDVVHSAAENVKKKESKMQDFSTYILEEQSENIVDEVTLSANKNKMRDGIISFLRKI